MSQRFRVGFSPQAQIDFIELFDFITNQSGIERARAYIGRLERYCLGFGQFPQRGIAIGHIRPGLRRVGFERRITLTFRIHGDQVVFHGVYYAGRQRKD